MDICPYVNVYVFIYACVSKKIFSIQKTNRKGKKTKCSRVSRQ